MLRTHLKESNQTNTWSGVTSKWLGVAWFVRCDKLVQDKKKTCVRYDNRK